MAQELVLLLQQAANLGGKTPTSRLTGKPCFLFKLTVLLVLCVSARLLGASCQGVDVQRGGACQETPP